MDNLNPLVEKLKILFADSLVSIVAHNSALLGRTQKDMNLLLVFNNNFNYTLVEATIKKDSLLRRYFQTHAVLLFTAEEISNSCDIFPIEFFEILETAETLFGENLDKLIQISDANLRLQVESNIRRNIILLRKDYPHRQNHLYALLSESFNNQLITIKYILKLKKEETKDLKAADLISKLSKVSKINPEAFNTLLLELEKGRMANKRRNFWQKLFHNYHEQLTILVQDIDSLLV